MFRLCSYNNQSNLFSALEPGSRRPKPSTPGGRENGEEKDSSYIAVTLIREPLHYSRGVMNYCSRDLDRTDSQSEEKAQLSGILR